VLSVTTNARLRKRLLSNEQDSPDLCRDRRGAKQRPAATGGRSKTTLTYAWKALEALRTPQEAVGTMPVTGVTPSPP